MNDINFYKKRTLILTQTNPQTDVMFKSWIDYNLNAEIIFKSVSKPMRALRRIVATKMPISFLSYWLNDWKSQLSQYNTVVIHASELTSHLPEYIHQLNPRIRIIYWYWNPVNKHTLPSMVTDRNVEFWTFDKADKEKYDMNFNIQYYPGTMPKYKKLKYDVYFIGHDKGRKAKINNIVNKIKNVNLNYKIDIISDNSKKYIPYQIVRKRIMAARAILEVNQKGQKGYTLRALEALFLEKKLITTNKSIINADFYSPQNIFVVGVDDWRNLSSFVRSPYNKAVSQLKSKYDVNAWFSNFFRSK